MRFIKWFEEWLRIKPPGPDGLSMAFFQANCDVMKENTMRVLEKIFPFINSRSLLIPPLSRIPKTSKASKLKDFHPISLVSGVYKKTSKVLANRMSMVMDKIISKPQHAFGRDRQILYFVLIA